MRQTIKSLSLIIALTLGVAAAAVPASAQDMKVLLWQKEVMTKISKNQRYPRSAVSRGIQGRAEVRIVVEKDGSIRGYEVINPTGEAVLDREIPRVITKISPLPPLPGEKEEVTLTVPLIWSLK